MWDLCHVYCMCMHTHTHSFAQSHACYAAAVLSCGFGPSVSTVVLYVLAAGVVAVCAFFVVFFLYLLTRASDGSPPGFSIEDVGYLLFRFCRCSGWLSGLSFSPIVSFYFCSVSFSLLSLFPCSPVGLAYKKYCNKNKQYLGNKGALHS